MDKNDKSYSMVAKNEVTNMVKTRFCTFLTCRRLEDRSMSSHEPTINLLLIWDICFNLAIVYFSRTKEISLLISISGSFSFLRA